MPAPRPILRSFESPTLQGLLASQTGASQFRDKEEDRAEDFAELQRARDFRGEQAEFDRSFQARQRKLDRDFQAAQAAAARSRQARAQSRRAPVVRRQAPPPRPAQGVQTFTRDGNVTQGGGVRTFSNQGVMPGDSPTALQDAGARSQARQGRSAQAVRQGGSPISQATRVPDPTQPDTGFGAITRSDGVSTFTAGGQMFTSQSPEQAEEDLRQLSQQSGQALDPRMLQAISESQAAPERGGFVQTGPPQGQVPVQVAQQLQTLQPYRNTLPPEDFQGLENAVRSGTMDTNQLVNQIEDAQQRQADLTQGPDDRRMRQMSVREHQLEVARLRRHKANAIAQNPYDPIDTTPYDDLIQRHQDAVQQIAPPPPVQDSGPPAGQSDANMVIVTNGQERFKIPRSQLGAAQADGFREER